MMPRVRIYPVFVPHWGCPHACVFCNQQRISGEHSPVDGETLREMLSRAAAALRDGIRRELAFYGGSFTAIPREFQAELLGEAREALEKGWIDGIRLSTRPDAIDPEILSFLKTYGVSAVELGAQSMNDNVLRQSARGHTAEDVVRASRLIREAGLELVLQMMTGLPGDSPGSCVETARKLIQLKPDGVRIYPTVVVRDTALYALWKAGKYREHSVEDAVRICARIVPLFDRAGIPILRLGLNPTEELSAGAAVAGAYHPALGELVRSRILLEEARRLLAGVLPGSRVCLGVSAEKISQLIGQHRGNIRALQTEFSLKEISVKPLSEPGASLRILSAVKGEQGVFHS